MNITTNSTSVKPCQPVLGMFWHRWDSTSSTSDDKSPGYLANTGIMFRIRGFSFLFPFFQSMNTLPLPSLSKKIFYTAQKEDWRGLHPQHLSANTVFNETQEHQVDLGFYGCFPDLLPLAICGINVHVHPYHKDLPFCFYTDGSKSN